MEVIKKFEEVIVKGLIGLMAIVVLISVVDLVWTVYRSVTAPPYIIFGEDVLLDVFGTFLLVLIGIELLEILQVYLKQRELSAEVILLVAIIALSKRIITLELDTLPGLSLVGIAALTGALGWAYYSIRKVHAEKGRMGPGGKETDEVS